MNPADLEAFKTVENPNILNRPVTINMNNVTLIRKIVRVYDGVKIFAIEFALISGKTHVINYGSKDYRDSQFTMLTETYLRGYSPNILLREDV